MGVCGEAGGTFVRAGSGRGRRERHRGGHAGGSGRRVGCGGQVGGLVGGDHGGGRCRVGVGVGGEGGGGGAAGVGGCCCGSRGGGGGVGRCSIGSRDRGWGRARGGRRRYSGCGLHGGACIRGVRSVRGRSRGTAVCRLRLRGAFVFGIRCDGRLACCRVRGITGQRVGRRIARHQGLDAIGHRGGRGRTGCKRSGGGSWRRHQRRKKTSAATRREARPCDRRRARPFGGAWLPVRTIRPLRAPALRLRCASGPAPRRSCGRRVPRRCGRVHRRRWKKPRRQPRSG